MAILPNVPERASERASEREASPTSGRKQDRAAFADAFGGEVRQAEKKAKGAVDGREKQAEGEAAENRAAERDGQTAEIAEPAKDGVTGAATRDVLGLLAPGAGLAQRRDLRLGRRG